MKKLLILILVFSFSMIVKAEAPDGGTYYGLSTDYVQKIYGDNIVDRNGVNVGSIKSLVKKLRVNSTDSGYLYSMEPNRPLMDNNTPVSKKIEEDPGYLYLVKNGYPNKSPYDGSVKDNYYVTQLAVWMYSYVVYGYNDGTKVKNTLIDQNGNLLTNYTVNLESKTLVETAYDLYKGAKKAHDDNIVYDTDVSITINPSNTDLTKNGQYLTSSEISVTVSGSDTYTVTTTEGIVVDLNNNEKTTFNKDEKFKILLNKVKDTCVKVIVTASNTQEAIYRYASEDPTNDSLLYSEVVRTPLSENDEITLVYQANRVEIRNVDINTNNELAGTTLVLKDTNGNVISLGEGNQNKTNPWVTTDTPYSLVLAPGDYVLSSTIPSRGYALTTDEVTFTISADGTLSKEVVMKNKALVGVDISNRDEISEEELEGATLEIIDSSEKTVDSWITTSEVHHVVLSPGEYTLIEKAAPEGYDLVKEGIKFTVLADGSVSTPIIFRNTLTPIPVPITASTRSVVIGIVSVILLVIGGASLIVSIKRSKSI